jgi:hypothetical protein
MSRVERKRSSHSERCVSTGHGYYRISWVIDFYYPNKMYRTPRGFERITDEKGARRFCKKWGIKFPEGK